MIFKKDGKRELYNLDTDLSETKDVLAEQAEIATKLTALMKKYITDGRSTPGAVQKNEFDLSIDEATKRGKGKNGKKAKAVNSSSKSEPERAREMALAADASFD